MERLKTSNTSVTGSEKTKNTSDSNNTDMISSWRYTSITTTGESDVRIVQNFRLVWLDSGIDEDNNNDSVNTITKLRQVVDAVQKFRDVDECIDFMTDIQDEKIFMICSGELGQKIVPFVQEMAQINYVYIFCKHKARHEQWAKEWSKVKGVYTDITSICEALRQAALDCDQNSVSISFVKTADDPTNQNLDTLDPSFMYTQILKEILLTIDFEQKHVNEFLMLCREQFAGNIIELKNVNKIEKEYHDHQPIWWYTYECFLYSMLNRALRLMEVDLIIKMGFFLRDLHNHIAALNVEQYDEKKPDSFIVYRGQGLSQTDFDQLMETHGGLLAFNNFLSTSTNYDVSLGFTRRTISTSSLVGVLFILQIDSSILATPFANVRNVSYFKGEGEILFSMHSVFRIGQMKQIDGNSRLWQVHLTLTGDNDPQLHVLTQYMREETTGFSGWDRLSLLMIKLGQYNKAEELCQILLKQTTNESGKAYLFYQLGSTKNGQRKYTEAIAFYEKALEIYQRTFPANHPDLATFHNTIGNAHHSMSEYSKALLYYEKALEIRQKTLPMNHPDLATSYNSIGSVCNSMGEESKALLYSEKAVEIREKALPPNHPDLASSYNNIGMVYYKRGEYSKALSTNEKALVIYQKTFPSNHPDLATSYNNIGMVYHNMGDYSKALSSHEKALAIRQETLPINHPDLADSYNNIGMTYYNMDEYSKALSSHEKALAIRQETLPISHPDLAISYNNIGRVYYDMGEYSKALSSYEKALKMRQKTLPANHPDLGTSYNNIGMVYDNMGEHLKALSFIEKALEIFQKTLPANHPHLASSYNNIGRMYYNMGEYSKALSSNEKALEIREKTLPENHPDLATSYNNTGLVYYDMGEYSKALSSYEKAFEIRQKTLPVNHPDLADSYDNTGSVYYNIGEYLKALSSHEKAVEIRQKTLPENHPDLATSYDNIGSVYCDLGEYSKALPYYEKALEIYRKTLPKNHPNFATIYNNISMVYDNMEE